MTTPISLSTWLRDNRQQKKKIALNCVNGRLLDKRDSRFVTEASERAISARSHVENDFLARFERGQAAVRASFTPERVTEAAASAPARLWVVEHFLRDDRFFWNFSPGKRVRSSARAVCARLSRVASTPASPSPFFRGFCFHRRWRRAVFLEEQRILVD